MDFFVLNETVSSGHLWFLPALVYCYLIYNVIMNKLPDKVVLSISLILMFFYLTAEEFLPIISVQLPTYVYGNAIVRAFPCFMLGFAVKKYKQFLSDYIPTWGSFVILGVGILETIISSILFGNSTTYLGSIFIIFALLLLAMKFEKKTYNQVLVKLSGYSLYIYVFHIAIGGVLQIFLNYFGVGNEMWWINIKPIVVFVFSIILSFVIDYVLNFIRDKRTQLALNE